MTGSLTDVRVVDVTTNVSGPFATQILGDLGADVIKVERPGGGDDTRGWGPPFWGERVQSVTFSTLNRNKRSIALDLKSPDDRELFDELVRKADVLVENMRPGAFEALGFGKDRLADLNPRLVYCQISGFGSTGPRAKDPAYDPLMQAFSGLMSITGEAGRPPVRIPPSILDKGSGLWAVIGILNALRLRDQTGRGAHIETSLLETALMWEPGQLMGYVASKAVPKPIGSAAPGIAPYQAFAAKDKYFIVAAGNQRLWEKLCVALERPDLISDERYLDNAARVRNLPELVAELNAVFCGRNAAEWLELLGEAGIPCTAIQTIDEVVADEQVRAIGMITQVPHPVVPEYSLVHTPLRTDGQRFVMAKLPPGLDADGADIRREHGR